MRQKNKLSRVRDVSDTPAAVGGFEYRDGSKYLGDWNERGQRHGFGHLVLPDSTRYDGSFFNGLFSGLGVLQFSDGARLVFIIIFSSTSDSR